MQKDYEIGRLDENGIDYDQVIEMIYKHTAVEMLFYDIIMKHRLGEGWVELKFNVLVPLHISYLCCTYNIKCEGLVRRILEL